jgi:hypothetical protein
VRGTLRLAGKLTGRGVVNAVRPGASSVNGGRLFFAADAISGKKFLVATGSSYSILPHRSSAPQSGPSLRAANNRRIRCWGYRSAAVAVNGWRYEWNFLLADVRFPIIGIDFLRQFQLVVDVSGAAFSVGRLGGACQRRSLRRGSTGSFASGPCSSC